MNSPNSIPQSTSTSTQSQSQSQSPSIAINPATKKKEITAVQAAKAKAMNSILILVESEPYLIRVHRKFCRYSTNDGSFLERFKKMKEEEVEKKKQEDALQRKQAFEQRIKNRGKRSADSDEKSSSKKPKPEDEDNAYLREVRKLQGHSLRDEGAGWFGFIGSRLIGENFKFDLK
ncbi:uncharacterized protein MELLADRAFT_68691 [Melampsora larici-populina 98AG31]|uniref:Uncharacterized protein n=1 Tax=Melampsora larici-populina (strain 98AG31 / pathotype 3-4-7) TaxID=747676 RepID=F4S7U2_MELLP|nr:uncharacterized protein MELLADRAFT_68691 [Melampsora larici-populina 98AG31]EGF99301.1 hypothetical protein MELLADRAFT_68691 [Melampsora larici-populina 98AG31]